MTRELVTEPANIIYPETFVERVPSRSMEAASRSRCSIARQWKSSGMGALLGVAQGSVREARMLVMRWNGGGGGQPVAFVGKGVTFDTGRHLHQARAGHGSDEVGHGRRRRGRGRDERDRRRKAKANIVGICGLVENMPSGNAQRPGDVVTTMSGQTVEVINTDAEGRLVLADAITYVQRNYKPKTIIDLATLTGAILISLGHELAGLFSNNDELAAQLHQRRRGKRRQAMAHADGEAFDRLIDSPIADMKNVGPREGGSITAAQFIQRFVENGVALGAYRHGWHGLVGQAGQRPTTRARPASASACSTGIVADVLER